MTVKSESEATEFKQWCIVELMGHQRMAGFVSSVQIAGAGMLRVDVPETSQRPAFTRFINPTSLYALNPTSEENARAAAGCFQTQPVHEWELRHKVALPAAAIAPDGATVAADDEDDDLDPPY